MSHSLPKEFSKLLQFLREHLQHTQQDEIIRGKFYQKEVINVI